MNAIGLALLTPEFPVLSGPIGRGSPVRQYGYIALPRSLPSLRDGKEISVIESVGFRTRLEIQAFSGSTCRPFSEKSDEFSLVSALLTGGTHAIRPVSNDS